MRILIIENDLNIASFIKIGLESYGYSVDIVQDYLLPFPGNYDIIIFDTEIEGNLDLELCKKIWNNLVFTKAIMMTSPDTVDELISEPGCKVHDCLMKPFTFEELLTCLHSANEKNPGRFPGISN